MREIEVQIAQDIRKYKTKDIGNFSLKECAFLVAAGAVGICAYKYGGFSIDGSIFCALPIIVVGFLKPFGLSFGEFVKTVVKEEFINPRTYINESDFEYDPEELETLFKEDGVTIPECWNDEEAPYNYKHSKEDLKQMIR